MVAPLALDTSSKAAKIGAISLGLPYWIVVQTLLWRPLGIFSGPYLPVRRPWASGL